MSSRPRLPGRLTRRILTNSRTGLEKFTGTTLLQNDAKSHPSIDPLTNRFNGGQGYSFDKNGNLTHDAEGRDFVFNGENKQRLVKTNGSTKVGEYFYDGEGKRVRKIEYDAGAIKSETVFVYSAGKLVEEYSTEPVPANPTTRWTATDHLGSPRVITDSNGAVISRRDFMPFGEELAGNIGNRLGTDATVANSLNYGKNDGIRQKFTGYQKDTETNLDFAEARMYENRHGRFTAVDPLLASGKSANPQTFNRYVYVLNRPIRFIDPSGLQVATHNDEVWVSPDGKQFNTYQQKDDWSKYKGPTTVFVGNGGYWWEVSSGGWRRLGRFEGQPVEIRAEPLPDLIENEATPIENAIPQQGIEFLPGNNLTETDQRSISDTVTSMLSSPSCRQSFLDGGLRNPFSQKLYFGSMTQLTSENAKALGLTTEGVESASLGVFENAVTASNNRVWGKVINGYTGKPFGPMTVDDNPRIFVNPQKFFGERSWTPTWLGNWSSRTNVGHEMQHGAGKRGEPSWWGGHDLRWFNPTHNKIIDTCSQ